MSEIKCGPAEIVDVYFNPKFTEYDAGAFGKIKVQHWPEVLDNLDCPEGTICVDGQCVSDDYNYNLTEEENKGFDSVEGCTPEEIENAKKIFSRILGREDDLGFTIHMDTNWWKPGDVIKDELHGVEYTVKSADTLGNVILESR